MTPYKNLNGDSGIQAYSIGDTFIDVQFKKSIEKYRYSYMTPGQKHVEIMKQLAIEGAGLNRYINKFIKKNYDSKFI